MLRLLAFLAGLSLLALLLFARRAAPQAARLVPVAAGEVLAADADLPATAEPLEALSDATDLRRESRPDALPRVLGHLRFAGAAEALEGGEVRVVFEDYHDSALDAETAHARALAQH